jgi:hypothetical protein
MNPVEQEDVLTQPRSSGFNGPYQRRSDYESSESHEPKGWHFKKELSPTTVVAFIGIAIAGITGYTDLRKDIALIQMDSLGIHKEISVLHIADSESLERWKDDLGKLNVVIDKIDLKLDRLIEKGSK